MQICFDSDKCNVARIMTRIDSVILVVRPTLEMKVTVLYHFVCLFVCFFFGGGVSKWGLGNFRVGGLSGFFVMFFWGGCSLFFLAFQRG